MRSFRLRIVLWYTLIAMSTLVIVRFASVRMVHDSLQETLDRSLEGEMRSIRGMLHSYRSRNLPDEEIREEILLRSQLSPRKEMIEIYDIGGQEYFRSPNLEQTDTLHLRGVSPLADSVFSRNMGGDQIRMIMSRDEFFEIAIGHPLADIDTAVDQILFSFVILIPVAALLLIGGGLFLVTRFVKPIKELRKYAARLMDQPLDRDLPELTVRTKDEIGLLIEQINEMVHRMRSSMRQVLGFSTLASHELRTPLAVIRNELEEGLREGQSTEAAQRSMASTYDEVLRLKRVVDDLLSLSTMQAGTFRLQLRRSRLDILLEEFCEEAEMICRQSGLSVIRSSNDALTADLDSERFRYVLFNLLDNAVRHTPRGGTISVSLEQSGSRGIIRFADNGSGIPVSVLPYIFDPFRRVDEGGSKEGGAGLGLALVKWITEAHSGSVTVESQPKRGTTFIISLPLSPPRESHHNGLEVSNQR